MGGGDGSLMIWCEFVYLCQNLGGAVVGYDYGYDYDDHNYDDYDYESW